MRDRKPTYDAVIAAPFGRVGVRTEDERVVDVGFVSSRIPLKAPRDVFTRRVCRALSQYFADPKRSLRLPLTLQGSAHQQRVWRALTRIPAGEVRSYGDLARRLKSSPRAIGAACRTNPIAIIVPCHRVVAQTGLGGFMGRRGGDALKIKRWLLEHERGT
ncbi:MAG: methylated-DNA--[protein]-cysteine S-methyltransferase [Sulfurifustis sp.]